MATTPAKVAPAEAAAKMFADLKAKAVKVEAAKVFVDKKTLIGVPFIITGWALIPSESAAASKRKVVYAEVKYVTEAGTEGSFRDSSQTGIKSQLIGVLGDGPATQGVWFEQAIYVPEGVIAREFDAENSKGEKIKSTVHMLSV